MRSFIFRYDRRLGISIPELNKDWDEYTVGEREEILFEWEQNRGKIPQRIKILEQLIIENQERLDSEEDFTASCSINWEIAELASVINDLHLWFRLNQSLSSEPEVSKVHG